MKVVGVSNFNLESVSDILIAENLTEEEASVKCKELNEKLYEGSTYWYMSKKDDYELWDASKLY